jgi:2-hydroxychromene-2-carboxylate isomerase
MSAERPVVVDFYFDPVSPYAWLASAQLGKIEAVGVSIRCQPVLFAGLLNAHGGKGPAEIPAKRAYTFRDVLRNAARLGLPFVGPPTHPFNPLRALRMCIAVEHQAQRKRLALALLDAAWARGEDVADSAVLEKLARGCELDAGALLAATERPEIKQRLIDATREAVEGGVFGVPTFRLGEELFWGSDRIDALLWRLQGNGIDEARLASMLARGASARRSPVSG